TAEIAIAAATDNISFFIECAPLIQTAIRAVPFAHHPQAANPRPGWLMRFTCVTSENKTRHLATRQAENGGKCCLFRRFHPSSTKK
ncbi:MAG TPA: hypothetical protein VH558_08870, partial [Pseudolabrys sp.]